VRDIHALVLNCTLKASPSDSSTELLGRQLLDALRENGAASGGVVRVVDHDVRFGVSTDEGDGDEWPTIRQKALDADIVVLATPVWMGQPSAVAKMVLERLDAELSEADGEGRMTTYDKVALVAVVGNEDGAHHVSAEVYQALNDTGFSLAPNAVTYWVGQAMQGTDYQDLDATPDETANTTQTAARNAVHLARLLAAAPYPAG
jgi:multimeric flavodoxin WrbA